MPTINRPKRKPREHISDKRRERQFIYQRPEWRAVRTEKIKLNPLCERCLESDRITPVQEVHHIQSFMKFDGDERWEKAYDIKNLMSLCQQCHTEIHHAKNEKYYDR